MAKKLTTKILLRLRHLNAKNVLFQGGLPISTYHMSALDVLLACEPILRQTFSSFDALVPLLDDELDLVRLACHAAPEAAGTCRTRPCSYSWDCTPVVHQGSEQP